MAHMELLLQTTTNTIAFVFTSRQLGVICGAVGCRFVENRFDGQFLFAVGCLVEALSLAPAPYVGHVNAFIAIAAVQGLAFGFYNVCKFVWLT